MGITEITDLGYIAVFQIPEFWDHYFQKGSNRTQKSGDQLTVLQLNDTKNAGKFSVCSLWNYHIFSKLN